VKERTTKNVKKIWIIVVEIIQVFNNDNDYSYLHISAAVRSHDLMSFFKKDMNLSQHDPKFNSSQIIPSPKPIRYAAC